MLEKRLNANSPLIKMGKGSNGEKNGKKI